MLNNSVSVIIPFYNAREFVTQAVHSALAQPETSEVLLVEDDSPDEGLVVCQELANKNKKVRLLRHPDKGNHGAAASRNLGIVKAKYPFIAFLDADDYYLQNRFSRTFEVFNEHPDAQGVYEAIGVFFQNKKAREAWDRVNLPNITTVNRIIAPEELFNQMLFGRAGYFSFDGFTGKRELFSYVSMFNDNLKYLEDSELMFKLAAKAKLYPGSIDNPVAVRRVHEANRITRLLNDKRKIYGNNIQLWQSLMSWSTKNVSEDARILIALRFVERLRKADYFSDYKVTDFLESRNKMMKLALNYPKLFTKLFFWRMVIPSKTLLKF